MPISKNTENFSDSATERAFLAMGANLLDRENTLQLARNELISQGICKGPLVVSSIYETPYWSDPALGPVEPQPAYLNQIVGFFPAHSPIETLRKLLKLEADLGRDRSGPNHGHNEPRTIDLDLLAWPKVSMNSDELILPHPRLHLRRFILLPWNEIAENYLVFGLNATVSELLTRCPDQSEISLYRAR